ncbi:hypothetical protein AV521_31305 [Streptomyces sp. IMTB 2501]|uniref:HNH endonuclease n=1 Tax=Streptomyces sp. IMTB 2501 TaxID=1776340 RepID=UPI00096F725C|nr:HNH endonuclease [Streptomyces sp. IMTB 2501]OLZ65549.1 hypothetical protein AV521_31305 [Streptomyces sp. IMTB 2501]
MMRSTVWTLSIDHVVHESEGGAWAWDDLQTAHYGCNILRGAASIEEVRTFAHEFMRRLAAQPVIPDQRESTASRS